MVWQVILCGLLAVSESGDWSSFLKAEQLFYEVYGKKIEAAKTPEAKAALAKELLELAKKETDQLAKRVELEQAKRLAVEAEAVSLAVDIVRALVEAFPETSLSQTEIIERAELLWKEAETKHGKEQLAYKVDAIELWLNSSVASELSTKKWSYRLGSLLGTIIFDAKNAHLVGAVNYVPHVDSIGDWIDPTAFVEWQAWLEPGTYAVNVTYAHGYSAPSGIIGVALLNDGKPVIKPLGFIVQPTGQGFVFRSIKIGTIRLSRHGLYTLRVHVVHKFPSALHIIQLRSVTLVVQSGQ